MAGTHEEVKIANDGKNGNGSEYERFFYVWARFPFKVNLQKSFEMCALVHLKCMVRFHFSMVQEIMKMLSISGRSRWGQVRYHRTAQSGYNFHNIRQHGRTCCSQCVAVWRVCISSKLSRHLKRTTAQRQGWWCCWLFLKRIMTDNRESFFF